LKESTVRELLYLGFLDLALPRDFGVFLEHKSTRDTYIGKLDISIVETITPL
jgi:hypothetical protein